MEVEVVRIWSSPSVLHLRVIVWGRQHRWFRSTNIAIRWDALPSEVRRQVRMALEDDVEPDTTDLDQPLF